MCSAVVHAAFAATLLVASRYGEMGHGGGTQQVIDVSLDGFGFPGAGELSVPLAAFGVIDYLSPSQRIPELTSLSIEFKLKEASRSKQVSKRASSNANSRQAELLSGTKASLGLGFFGSGGGSGGAKKRDGDGSAVGQENFTRASLLDAPKPSYPPLARMAGFEGEVVLKAEIDLEGRVADALIEESSGRKDCDTSAKETVLHKWQFEPAKINGTPVKTAQQIIVKYNLQRF